MMMMLRTAAKSRATARRQRKKKLFRFAVLISNSFRRGNTTISFIKVEDGKKTFSFRKNDRRVLSAVELGIVCRGNAAEHDGEKRE